MTIPRTAEEVRAAVERELPRVLADLEQHVAIESVSADSDRADQVRASAEFVAGQLRDLGAADVLIDAADGGQPAVIAHFPAPEGKPTICLYAHHDVQPEGDPALWDTGNPFQVTQKDDRLFARGVTDDKGGLAMHLAMLRAYEGKPPVGITVFVEGEEEVGSPTLKGLLDKHRDRLASDVFVIGDSGNFAVGLPTFTNTLRGLAEAYVEVRTIDHALHSGGFGGVIPDALMVLVRLLATLHDDQGNVAVEGLHSEPAPEVDYPEERIRQESAILDGVEYIGDGSFAERLWSRPSITIVGLDATPVARASNTLWPSASAKISMRLAPGEDAAAAQQKLIKHLESHVPWGAQVTVRPGEEGDPSVVPFEGPYAEAARSAFRDAWEAEPVFMGQGGSIPMIADFQRAYPDATVLVTGVGDPDSRPHGSNESLHLGDFRKACLSEALLVHNIATL
jgi:acetylornithine deacetylase/succinyl-diaminopimelate desuccinylase-like protein